MSDKPTCSTCRCWQPPPTGERMGQCHKHAPRPLVVLQTVTATPYVHWPETPAEEWCAEWQPAALQQGEHHG